MFLLRPILPSTDDQQKKNSTRDNCYGDFFLAIGKCARNVSRLRRRGSTKHRAPNATICNTDISSF